MRDHLGIYYDKTSDFQNEQFETLCRLVKESLPDRGHVRRMLDIGAGTGSRTIKSMALFPAIEQAVAIEPDWEMMAVAREKYADPRIDYRQIKGEDMGQLVAEHQRFEAVVSNWALHWVSGKDKVMEDINAMTAPGSLLMFSTCEALPSMLVMIDEYVRNEFLIKNAPSPFFYLNAEEWRALLEKHGWEVTGEQKFRVDRELDSAKLYLDAWFAASTTKFMYGKHLAEMPAVSHSSLIWMMERAFPSQRNPDGIAFHEDTLFMTAKRS